jgi:two-component system sensor histidine kinase YesM
MKWSLKFKIASVLFSLILVFLLLLTFYISGRITKDIEKDTIGNIYARQEEMDRGLAAILDSISLIYSPFVENSNLSNIFNQNHDVAANQQLYDTLIAQIVINGDIFGDIILFYQNEFYHSPFCENIIYEDPAFGNMVAKSGKSLVFGSVVTGTGNEKYLIFGKPFSRYYLPSQDACLIFCIKEEIITNVLDNISKDLGYSFVLSEGRIVISHPEKDYIGRVIFDGETFNLQDVPSYSIRSFNDEKSIIITSSLSNVSNQYDIDWYIISILSYNTLLGEVYHLNFNTILIAIAMAGVALLLAIAISGGITRPIKLLSIKMKRYRLSDPKEEEAVPVSGDEIWELEKSFNDMLSRISGLIATNALQEESKRQLELYALQMQINPHFLYNTLDAIAWLAKIKKETEIERLVMALAQFFRISLHKGDKFITVDEEVELIRNFIEIELIRFPDKFNITYHIDEEIRNVETMKLILQPIVENAIKHGISGLGVKGNITINAYGQDGYICYEVIDDGIGFDPNSDCLNKKHSSGYGIKNVDERIKLEYGNDCGVTVFSKPHGGTKVIIRFKRR